MSESLSIHIPKPCHEDWSRMNADERGRHCAVCDKVVRDFVGMDPQAVVEEIAAATTQVCGRFDRAHIAPPALEGIAIMRLPAERMRLFVLAFVMTFGLEVWGVSSVDAQTTQPAVGALRDAQNLRAAVNPDASKEIILNGKVVDVYTREPVAHAQLRAYNKKQLLATAMSDTLGNFELRINKDAFAEQHYTLKLRYMGRERVDHEIERDVKEFLYLIDASNMMEAVAISDNKDYWTVDAHNVMGITMMGTGIQKSTRSSTIYYPSACDQNNLYRPLDEWLMMHSSEIHHNGRW